jgi:hypothetical protein
MIVPTNQARPRPTDEWDLHVYADSRQQEQVRLQERMHREKAQKERALAEAEQARIKAASLERQQIQQIKMDAFLLDIDYYMRSRKKFDGRSPRAYKCNISTIQSEFADKFTKLGLGKDVTLPQSLIF